jgi:hypothetical protein
MKQVSSQNQILINSGKKSKRVTQTSPKEYLNLARVERIARFNR